MAKGSLKQPWSHGCNMNSTQYLVYLKRRQRASAATAAHTCTFAWIAKQGVNIFPNVPMQYQGTISSSQGRIVVGAKHRW